MLNSNESNKNIFAQKLPLMMAFLSVVAVIVGIDLWTKYIAVEKLVYEGNSYAVIPDLFSFTLRYNHGAAFSFLSGAGGWQRWFFAGIAAVMSVVLTVWLSRIVLTKKIESVAIVLILAGALGNLYDRMTLGYVVDFLHAYYRDYHFPAFNIADCSITCGAALLIFDSLFLNKNPNKNPNKNSRQDTQEDVKNG
ncbi:MAG: signal peptidase II [Marinagarivorans sp.]|nr:signal peptidase II [Marinagarivorans sp.]